MNARIERVMDQVSGELLHAGYQYDDGLVLDLYGDRPTADEGFSVKSIAVSGATVEIVRLFRPRQLENMSNWLDLKGGGPAQREWADRHKHHAAAYAD